MGEPIPDDLTERTLYHLSVCSSLGDELEESDMVEMRGPENSSWADLLAAIMEGLTRGWIKYANLTREEGATHCRWQATRLGEREIAAFRERLRNAPIVDETGAPAAAPEEQRREGE